MTTSSARARNSFAPWAATWEGLENQRPVVFLSLSLNYALGAFDVRGYHVVNLLVHLVAGLTLFGIVRRTLCLPLLACKYGTRANVLAFAIALLWLVHPLQTQAVTYTIQRCESMMGMFYLLALYALLPRLAVAAPRGSGISEAWLPVGWGWGVRR